MSKKPAFIAVAFVQALKPGFGGVDKLESLSHTQNRVGLGALELSGNSGNYVGWDLCNGAGVSCGCVL